MDLAASAGGGDSHLAGTLTATYPDEFREDLGRTVCVRHPNGGESWERSWPMMERRKALRVRSRMQKLTDGHSQFTRSSCANSSQAVDALHAAGPAAQEACCWLGVTPALTAGCCRRRRRLVQRDRERVRFWRDRRWRRRRRG